MKFTRDAAFLNRKMPKDGVEFVVLRDYQPPGFPTPLLRKGETTWMAGPTAEDAALTLAQLGYIKRTGKRGRPRKAPLQSLGQSQGRKPKTGAQGGQDS